MLKLPSHGRCVHSNITQRPDYTWPGGKRLAFYVALNIEHFAFGTGSALIRTIAAARKRRAIIRGVIMEIASAIGCCSNSSTN
jgi:hypothetical protein